MIIDFENSMDFSKLTWKEVEEYLKRSKDVILPLGSVEEHGYHLPLTTDGDIALAVANELGKRFDILVAPIVWYGVSSSTKNYPGSIMVEFDSLRDYLRDITSSLIKQGFKRIFIISGHLSSLQICAIKEAVKNFDAEFYLLDYSKIDLSDILETKPCHACEAETSLMLYLYPEKVKMEKAVDEEPTFEKYSLKSNIKPSKSGVFGYATKASREKGRRIFERIIDEFEQFIRSVRENER